MRVGMMMRDTEYRDAMVEAMSDFDKDIFIELAGPSGVSREAVILTDILPSEIETSSLEKIRRRTVFLSPVPAGREAQGCRIIFKYSSLAAIMAELTYVYSDWTGDTGSISPSTKIIAVTGESDLLSADRCRSLAGQILYRHGGTLMILPLGYVNDYIDSTGPDSMGWFRRLMYRIDEGKDYLTESFTFRDNYGISYLNLPPGINPLTELSYDYLRQLITSVGSHFDTLILDIGSCYSFSNLKLIEAADHVLFFGSGRRIRDPARFLGGIPDGKVRTIGASDAGEEAMGLDDFVSEAYGRTEKKKHDPEIQRGDRGTG